MRQPSLDLFLQDVQSHQMTVLHSDGLYRHLMFAKPDTGHLWFELVTWPEILTINGDMGTWTFSRVKDMFTFFRSTGELRINASYWGEKIRNGVHGGSDNAKVWDTEAFGGRLLEQLENYYSLEGEALAEVTEAVKEEVLCYDSEYEVTSAARDFEHRLGDGERFSFDPFDMPDGKEYAYHYIWCLYAIVWGIQQWDARVVLSKSA